MLRPTRRSTPARSADHADRGCQRPRDPRLARQSDGRGRHHPRRRRASGRPWCRPAPRPARTRRSSCATATGRATAARACCKAVRNVERRRSRPELLGIDAADQAALDRLLIELDGTPNKSKLGANAILGVSAWRSPTPPPSASGCRCTATSAAPLRADAAGAAGEHPQRRQARHRLDRLPGVHDRADRRADVPRGAALGGRGLPRARRAPARARACAPTVGDEGGFAPSLRQQRGRHRARCSTAIEQAGYAPGEQIAIALDPATTELYRDGRYTLAREERDARPAPR